MPGDFSEDPQTGFRFVGHALLQNTGNVGVKADVTATWFLAGDSKLTDTKTVRLKVDQHQRVGFSVPATQDQIDLHHASGGEQDCNVKATLTDTFGKPKA